MEGRVIPKGKENKRIIEGKVINGETFGGTPARAVIGDSQKKGRAAQNDFKKR